MIVFKGYLKGLKQNFYMIIIYLGVFFMLESIFVISANKDGKEDFTPDRYKVAVVDRDNSTFSKGLIEYMEKFHDVADLPDDKKVLSQELYYDNIQYVITIPEQAQELYESGETKIQTTAGVSLQNGWYIETKVEEYVNFMRIYSQAGYTQEEAVEQVLELGNEKPQVSLSQKSSGGGSLITNSFRFFPYIMMAILSYVLGYIFQEYRKIDLKRRLRASALPLRSQNIQALLAFLTVGVALLVICIGITIAASPKQFFTNENIIYFVGNAACMMLVSLAISFFVGTVAKGDGALSGLTNVISLAMCFIGGVFVPEELLSGGIKKVGVFLPTYWYEKSNTLLGEHGVLTAALRNTVYKGYVIQLLFAAACVALALVIIKATEQEKE